MRRPTAFAVLCAIVLGMNGCSLTYKKRVIKDADIGKAEVMEYGLLGIPNTPSDQPGGIIPLYRSETPISED
jgi:hypothetical protein